MRPRVHVICDVVLRDALQSRGVHDDHVIEAFASNGSDEPLDVGVGQSRRLPSMTRLRNESSASPIRSTR